jgi:hypothetical protein
VRLIVHQQRYCPSDSNTDYWEDVTLWDNTAAGGLLVSQGNILPVVSVTITGAIPLLVDY